MKLLTGDRALVTGVGNGIGRAMAAALKEEGAELKGRILLTTSLHAESPRNLPAKPCS